MITRILVCIPTYNNSGTIASVVSDVLAHSALNVLIIDDGSETPVSVLVATHPRVTVHRQPSNLGKGAALQTAFKIALAQNYTHIIAMDGDGQHKASDLPNMVETILTHPLALIIGKRKLDGEHVPGSSKFGRSFSNFWVKYQTDHTIEDSQSGFRAYPLFHVQHLKFYTKKYDFEIEVLIKLLWKKVHVKEIEIDVFYPPPHERVSHFDKFRDNVKISLLNTALVVFSLLRSNVSKNKIIASLALGVFVGVLPTYGLHTLILAGLSFIFRLNFPLMFIASQISMPPLIPVWTYVALKIGTKITHQELVFAFDEHILQTAEHVFTTLFAGSVVLGLVLALITAILGFFLIKTEKKKRPWSGKSRGGWFGNFFMKQVTTLFGPKTAYFFLFFICPYFYIFAPKAVISHNQFFREKYPSLGFFARQWLIMKTFYKLGQVLIDNMYSNSSGGVFALSRNGRDNMKKALVHNKGLVLIGAHVGGWMFAAKIFSTDKNEGVPLPQINVVEFDTGRGQNSQDKIENARLNFIQHNDEGAIFKIHQALGQNEVMIFMGDRVVNHNIELVPFMGKLAAIDSTAFKVALAKKTPVAFTFGFKGQNQTYDLFITDPVHAEHNGNKDEALINLMREFTRTLEFFMDKYPTQWFNFYPFWSALPSEEAFSKSKKSTHY